MFKRILKALFGSRRKPRNMKVNEAALKALIRLDNAKKAEAVANLTCRPGTVITVTAYPFGEKVPTAMHVTVSKNLLCDAVLKEAKHQRSVAEKVLVQAMTGGEL